MRQIVLTPPWFAFVVTTRAALAAGIGLLVASRLPENRRRAIGATLALVGAVTTVPAMFAVRRSFRRARAAAQMSGVSRDERLIGQTRFARKGDDEFV